MLLKQFVICDIYIYFRLLGICEKKKKCNCSIIVVDDDDDFKYCVLLTLYNGTLPRSLMKNSDETD